LIQIVPLAQFHDRTTFDCGVPELNGFLKATARQHNEKGISRTFVLSEKEMPGGMLGFFTLTLCEVRASHLPAAYEKKYPKHGLPAVRLARMAVSLKHQGKGYGGLLLAEAIHKTLLIAAQSGVVGLFVDAKNKRARQFYEKYGFVSLPSLSLQLFLPLETLRSATTARTTNGASYPNGAA
jgi:GNAT superfamily N-acetyltransferase